MVKYVLPESVVVISGTVEKVVDTRLPDSPRTYFGPPQATVVQSVRGDRSHGERVLEPPRKGDTDWTIQLTADQRLASVGYSSVGVGSKVVGAGAKLLAVVAGAAARLGTVVARRTDGGTTDLDGVPPTEEEARAVWEAANQDAVTHRATYSTLAADATAQLAVLRREVLTGESGATGAARRIRQVEEVLAAALAETAKVDGLYRAWTSSHLERLPRQLSFSLAIDELPQHGDPSSDIPQDAQDPRTTPQLKALWQRIWDELGVRVEIGAAPPETSWRPNTAGAAAADIGPQKVSWRVPRAARLWIWTRGADTDTAVLEKATDVWVTDRFSHSASLSLEGRSWGESKVEIAFDDLGQPSKLVQGDKSAVGAIADALAAVPDQVTSGLDAVTKASTSLGDLGDAATERRLKALKRQVEQRQQELELQGIDATADSFAELKRLQQQVDLRTAQGTLDSAGLKELENELAMETARRDLEARSRERQLATELATTQAEIARLEAQLKLLEAKVALLPKS